MLGFCLFFVICFVLLYFQRDFEGFFGKYFVFFGILSIYRQNRGVLDKTKLVILSCFSLFIELLLSISFFFFSFLKRKEENNNKNSLKPKHRTKRTKRQNISQKSIGKNILIIYIYRITFQNILSFCPFCLPF